MKVRVSPWKGSAWLLTSCAAFLCNQAVLNSAAVAQAAEGSGRVERTYTPQEFARFAPRTALDLVRLIPGFVIAEEEDRRGFEQTGNVLIDGRPVLGKSNDAVDALSRIPAGQVRSIQLTNATTDQAVGVARQIANVVLAQAPSRPAGQFSWRPSTRLKDADAAWLNGDASLSGKQGRLEYSVGLRNTALRTGASGPSLIFSPSGSVTDSRDEFYTENSDTPRLGGSLRYETPEGSILNGRASYQRFLYRFLERSERTGEDVVDRTRVLTQRERDRRFELGGDGEFQLGAGRLKVIGLHSNERSPIDTRVSTLFVDEAVPLGDRFLRNAHQRETVFRSEYRWNRGATSWLIWGERALNRLNNVSETFELQPNGQFEPLPLPGGSADIRERRHEASIAFTQRFSPTLTLQGAIGGELSELRLIGDLGSRRTFRRPKGYVSVAWQASSRLRATAKVERRVGQISFLDFLASRNLLEERENVANPNLVPPQSWDIEAELSRDLGALGSTTLRVYGQRIEDLIEQVPIGLIGQAPGNVDIARLYGVDWKSSLFLDRLGWAGGRIDGRMQFQKSSLKDPVEGRSRRISNNLVRLLDLSLRHDVPGTMLAWGAGLYHIRRAPDFRVEELARYREGPLSGNLYVEHKNVSGLTVRAALSNLISSKQELDRFIFDERRDRPLLWVERRRRSIGPVASLAVSGNF